MSEVEQTNKTEAATTLPSPYKITTSSNGEIVSISMSGSNSVSVQKSSLEDIKKVLSKFWPSGKDKMASGATMVLIDAFSGDGAKISLGSLLDIARVIDDLELIGVSGSETSVQVGTATKPRGRPKSSAKEKADNASGDTSQGSAVTTSDSLPETVSEVSKVKNEDVPVKRGRGRPRKVESEPTSVEPTPRRRGRPPKAVASSLLGDAPSWFGAKFHSKYEGTTTSGGHFSLNKVPLKLETPGSKHVVGIAKAPQDVMAWGYEMRSAGTHVAWVIVSGPDQLHIVSDDGSQAIPQTSIEEVITTISSRAPAKKAS
jgi:hypothetical protein